MLNSFDVFEDKEIAKISKHLFEGVPVGQGMAAVSFEHKLERLLHEFGHFSTK